jgi:hypothetical protein
MRKPITLLVGIVMVASPALAQVRPQDCRPVLPVTDKLAEMAPLPDVVADRAIPAAVAAKKGFFGLPFLLPLLAAGGGIAIAASDDGGGGGGGDDDGGPPVSPA